MRRAETGATLQPTAIRVPGSASPMRTARPGTVMFRPQRPGVECAPHPLLSADAEWGHLSPVGTARIRPQGQTSGVSESSRGEQGGPVYRVHFLPIGLGEPDLGQHSARSGVPVPDGGPQTFVP